MHVTILWACLSWYHILWQAPCFITELVQTRENVYVEDHEPVQGTIFCLGIY